MGGPRLTTTNDARTSFDETTGALRSFFGAELVGPPEQLENFNLNIHRAYEASSETSAFLEANEDLFKLGNISLEEREVSEGQATKSVRYQQYYRKVPVYGAELVIGLRAIDGHIISADNKIDYLIPDVMSPKDIRLSAHDAENAVRGAIKDKVLSSKIERDSRLFLYRHTAERQDAPEPLLVKEFWETLTRLSTGRDGELYWIWQVMVDTHGPDGNWEVLVDAIAGTIVAAFDRRSYAPPRAYVFMPDPITSSKDLTLSWNTDVNTLNQYRVVVTLGELDAPDANGYFNLSGKWVRCAEKEKATYPSPKSKADFMFESKAPEFLFTMTYYWTNELVKYLRGFNISKLNQKMIAPLEIDPMGLQMNQSGAAVESENSHFVENGMPYIAFGMGGIPDASDAHVIVHEYGHAVHYFLGSRQYCYEEGFCDFLAGVWLDRFNKKSFQRWKVFPWDANGSSWGNDRRFNLSQRFNDLGFKSYGKYLVGNILATALWDLYLSIGGDDANAATRDAAADAVIDMYLEMLLLVTSYAKPKVLAEKLLAVDQSKYGLQGKYRQQIWDAFKRRGLWTGNPPPVTPPPPHPNQ
jgi:hypothetical protein